MDEPLQKELLDLLRNWRSQYPDLPTLTAGLTCVFRGEKSTGGQVTVLDRQPAVHANTGTFPKEIVTCRGDDGRERRLLCKYGTGQGHNAYGHRGGVAYEVTVYREIIQFSQMPAPAFYGAFTNEETGEVWLILEYLDKCVRPSKALNSTAMGLAAQWIGRFHAANEVRLATTQMPFLNTYNAEYYRGWVRRTSVCAGHLHARFPWLAKLCERSEDFIALLLAAPQTVIHGEYYPGNVLFRSGTIYPVDWEAAAIAAGEIDLASLTERWPPEFTHEMEREYQRARWPDGPPADFGRRLDAARLYLPFRWLGERPDWATHESNLRQYEPLLSTLRSSGERLGLI
jgi:hypothetical protein